MANGIVKGLNTRMLIMTGLIALAITSLLWYLYPRIRQMFGGSIENTVERYQDADKDADQEDDEHDADEDDDSSEESDSEGSDEESDEESESDEDDGSDEDSDEEDESDSNEHGDDVSDADVVDTSRNVTVIEDPTGEVETAAAPETFVGAGPSPPSASSNGKKLIVVYASWCGHCKTLLGPKGAWKKVKKALPGVTIQELDESEHVDLVKALRIDSFPTIMILDPGSNTSIPFEGARTKDDIVDFVLKNIGPSEI